MKTIANLIFLIVLSQVPSYLLAENCAPKEFNPETIRQDVSSPAVTYQSLTLLSWKIEIEEEVRFNSQSPMYVESAIFFAKANERYVLGSVYRHPRNTALPVKWYFSQLHGEESGDALRTFDSFPANTDLAAFKKESEWQMGGLGFETVGSGDCVEDLQTLADQSSGFQMLQSKVTGLEKP